MANSSGQSYLPTQFFYVYSTLSSDTPLGLSIDTANGNAVVLSPWQGGQASELWVLVDNGSTFALQSALSITTGNDLYLAVGGSNDAGAPVVVTGGQWGWNIPPDWNNSSSSANALPNFQLSGAITTDNGNVAVAVQNGAASAGTPIVAATPDGSASQMWWIFPAVVAASPSPQWTRIASAMTDDEQNTLVLDLQNPGLQWGFDTPLILNLASSGSTNSSGVPTGSPSQMWQISPSGYILNGTGGTNVLAALGGNNTTGFAAGVAAWELAGGSSSRMWSLNENGLITSSIFPNLALSVVNASSGSTLSFLPIPAGTPPQAMIFSTSPAPTLETILAQPPVQFPQFTDDANELTAFNSINQQLGQKFGFANIRMEYLNTANTSLQSQLNQCTMPSGMDATAWQNVVNQLTSEISSIGNVNTLFSNYGTMNTALFADQSALVSSLQQAASMEDGTNTTGLGLMLFSDFFFSLVSMIPVVGMPLAVLGKTAMGAALAVHRVSPNPFTVAVSELWSTLADTFAGVYEQLGLMQTVLVTDWGKLQAMYAATTTGPLVSQPLSDDQANDMIGPFTVSIMKILLPAQYQIYTYQDDNDDPITGMGDYPWAQNIVPIPGTSMWQKSWIADSTNWSLYPAQQALQNDVFDITGQNWFVDTTSGWPFAVCWVYNYNGSGVYWAVVTVTNQTPQMMNVAVEGDSPVLLPTFSSASVMPPYTGGEGVNSNIIITDYVSGATLATFNVTMPLPPGKGATPSVNSPAPAAGYALSSAICNQGAWQAMKDGYPGTVQITISMT